MPPSPTAEPRPSPAPGFSRFSSALHGITIDYPAGWKVRPATEPWNHRTITFDASNVDVIFDPTLRDDLYLAMVSEPLGSKAATEWVQAHVPPTVGICKGAIGSGGGDGALDGNYAWFEYCADRHGARWNVVIVAKATRGYIIYLLVADERRLQATYDWHWFRRVLLETLGLRPEDSLDASNPSESS